MVDKKRVREQLAAIGADFRFWGRAEANELPQLLFDDEVIEGALNGRYEKGFALLVATNHRLLLLDKKPFVLCFEDMRYEMVSEVEYTEQAFTATLFLRKSGRVLQFMSYRIKRLRGLTTFIKDKMTHTRHIMHDMSWQYNAPTQQTPSQTFYRMVKNTTNASEQSGSVESLDVAPGQLYMNKPTSHVDQRPNYHSMAFRARRRIPKFTPPTPNQASKP